MADDIDLILNAAKAWCGKPMALATVIATWGSAPRPRGSHMLICEDGRFAGSVSGGCVEGEILEAAANCIEQGSFSRHSFGVTDAMAWETGLPCGGEIEILIQPVGDGGFPAALFEAITAERAKGVTAMVSTDLETGRTVIDDAGRESVFINRYPPPRRLLIVGAVHIAQPLARIASELGIAVTVIDPRTRFLTEERFPDTALDDRWPDEAIAALAPDAATAIVTLSHDPKIDDAALIAALETNAAYIGALGSKKSHKARLARLREAGASDGQLDRIDGPAGIDIGKQGPAGIALSIVAAIAAAFVQNTP